MIDNPDMPNPFLIILMFGFALLIVRAFTTTIHELGHAIAGLMLYSGKLDVFIGTYGNKEKGFRFSLGRLNFYFVYAPFSFAEGVVMYTTEECRLFKNFIVTLAGPLASLLASLIIGYIAIFSTYDDVIKIVLYIVATTTFRDFWHNIKFDEEPITLNNGIKTYNDGYKLRELWIVMKTKEKI